MGKPTLVLVHGAFHRPIHWDPVKHLLESHGYRVVTPALPSTLDHETEATKNADSDVELIRNTILDELQTSDVILVLHSWSGIPGSSALPGLDTASRKATGHTTSVLAIAGIATFIKPAGKSAMDDPSDSAPPSPAELDETGTKAILKKDPGPIACYYHDVPREEAEKWAAHLGDFSVGAVMSPCTFSAYEKFPVHYLVCTDDRSLPVDMQRKMMQDIRDAGYEVSVEEVWSSHSPFLSMPERTAEFIRRSAGEEI
jgi:pimeloyl-ACP methyl ester carboxylesterase